MPLTSGIDHVALVTKDLDALTAFYVEVLDAEIDFDLNDGLRHAGINVGGSSYIHAFEMSDNPHATGLPHIFERGHLDHVSLMVRDDDALQEIRRRLVARGASDGLLTDWGSCRQVGFVDPDGYHGEVSLLCGGLPVSLEDRRTEAYVGV